MTKTKKAKEKRVQDASIRIRLLSEQDALLRKAAGRSGLSLSAWIRDRLLRIARKELGVE